MLKIGTKLISKKHCRHTVIILDSDVTSRYNNKYRLKCLSCPGLPGCNLNTYDKDHTWTIGMDHVFEYYSLHKKILRII